MKWTRRLVELMEDWSFFLQRDGWETALPTVLREVARLPYRRLWYVVVARSLLVRLPDLQPKISLEIRPISLSDLDLVRQIDRPSEASAGARRIAHGHKGLLALHHSRPVGYAWACDKIVPTLERVQLTLDQGDFLCVDAYTIPSLRGRGIQTALTMARLRMFREEGYHRVVAYIEERNAPSLAMWQKIGARKIGRIDFRRIGPWRWSNFSQYS